MQVSTASDIVLVRRTPGSARARTTWRLDEAVLGDLGQMVAGEGALRRALAAVAGRVVATKAWERLGFARMRDYAVERAGVSVRQLQDLARVDALLRERPAIAAALVEGQLSWTQARLLCRVATAEDEEDWCERAARLTARELAREVRAVDARSVERGGADPPATAPGDGEEEPWERLNVRCTQGGRGRWGLASRLAERTAGRWLPRWQCAEVVAAEVFSTVGISPEGLPSGSIAEERETVGAAPEPQVPTPPRAAMRRCRPPPLRDAPSDALVEALEEADAFELDDRLRRGLALEQRRLSRMGPLLLRVANERLFQLHGHRSFDAYARDELAMSPSAARALLRLERLARVSETFRRAWRSGRVSSTQAQTLAPLLSLEGARAWHAAWIARAARVSVRRLRDDVEDAVARGAFDPARLGALPPGLRTGARPKRPSSLGWLRFGAPRSVARLFRAVLASVQRRIEQHLGRPSSEQEALDAMLEHVLESWGLDRPAARKYAVFERDGWRCTVPGCTSYDNLQDHHIRFRSAGGSDALENRTTLCAFHHLRGVHAGNLVCRGRAPEGLEFELGVRPGQRPLMRFRSGDRVVG